MHIHRRTLYRKTLRVPRHLRALLAVLILAAPYHALTNPSERTEPYQQEFILTAYYSPLPGQCCYVKGGLEADKILNGEGIRGADGTAVYPGMIAAPSSYAFGTVVALPGLGTLAVHDRGGAIVELGSAHRLDVWAGYGEEGLARALAFGVQRITGTVYPLGTKHPAEQFALESLPAPVDELTTYFIERDNLLALRPRLGDKGLSVSVLQEKLRDLGYLERSPTGFYGAETQAAFGKFLKDFSVNASPDALTETSASYLVGAIKRIDADAPVSAHVDDRASPGVIAEAQRILRFLGYYRGRTDGVYGDALKAAILQFQQQYALAGDAQSPGAGRIGPLTLTVLTDAWNKRIVDRIAARAMDAHKVDVLLAERGKRIAAFLEEGYTGNQVRALQQFLADRALFPSEKINGTFGPLTRDAVAAYQLSRGIIQNTSDKGSGIVGPETLRVMRTEQRSAALRVVRASGWKAL